MVGILIVDDHPLFRKGVIGMLAPAFPDAFFGEAGTAEEALTSLQGKPWDVVVLDLAMPDRNGLELLTEIMNLKPDQHVLVLSMHPEAQYAKEALRRGAHGYLTKCSAPDELVQAIRSIISGHKYLSQTIAELLISDLRSGKKLPHERLTPRELQVMRGLVMGKSVTEIAEKLSLSVKTVSTFRTRILRKMKMKTNADLTRYAMEHSVCE